MDQVTHALTGLMLSRAGADRWCRHAAWLLPLAALTPDVDLVSALGGTLSYVHIHRGFTHALVMAPVMALLPVALVWLFSRRGFPWVRAYLLSLLGVASHLLLDWTNPYGVRFLLPFSDEWIGLGIAHIVNVWIWAVLLVAVAAPFLARLVNAEMGARSSSGRGWAIFALASMAVILFGSFLMHQRAVAVLEARLARGATPLRVAAVPGPLNPLRWSGIAETESFFTVSDVNLLAEFDPNAGGLYYKPEMSPALEAAQRTHFLQDYARFSPFLLWRVKSRPQPESGFEVEAMDLRFGTPEEPAFVMTTILDEKLRAQTTRFEFSPKRIP